MKTTAEIREGFLSFFEEKGHQRRPRGSLVPPPEDVSTLLTVAGMQPLKPFMLGEKEPPAPRLTTAQPVFRVVDIDEVGLSPSHLTLFEMMGNFSLGDYFKDGAVELAWEFVTERLRLDPERLWISIYEGNPARGIALDEAANAAWLARGIPPERIMPMGGDNFWELGPPGPCGPCSELYYDRGERFGCGEPDCGLECPRCKRYLEFWNLVFMEFDQTADGVLTPLPKQNIDTGLGLERAAVILQEVPSVFDTDGYQTIMDWVAGESGTRYGESEEATKAHRVLADHARGMTFLAGDGVVPSNEGRGYVLRRIIRRAVQHAGRIGMEPPYLARLADVVIDQMREHYPELAEHRDAIHRVLEGEEERFAQTLARGMKLFEEAAADGDLSGEEAFRLYDTHGFPPELTRELARERGLAVDEEEFTRLMEEQRERSRAAAGGRASERAVEFARVAGFRSEFVGYEKLDVLTQIGALEELEDGFFLVKLRESPFYAEGGGQVTDLGHIEREETGARAELREAYRFEDDQVLLFQGEGFAAGDRVRAVVAWGARFPTMANHTATHLLHAALREVLGDHVKQAGSAVRPDKLRFDFTHPQALTADERHEIEQRVNRKIFENLPVRAFITPIEEARKLGAMMLFGEKYGEHVRVVEIPGSSSELCGGTHVRWTAEIGPFVLLSEGSVGAGARRIEAVTSAEAYAHLAARAHEAEELRHELERVRKEAKSRPAAQEASLSGQRESEVGGVTVLVAELEHGDADQALEVSDREKLRRSPAAVVIGARENGKVHLVANFDADVAARISASDVVQQAAALVGGGGGGRPTMARAGGKHPEKLGEALAEAERLIHAALS
jgi:alanyl-tRNA synthetase